VLRAAQRRHPDDVWVNYNLAHVLEELGRTDEAIRYYTAARSIRPETAHELAHALENRGESDEAIEVFRQLCLIRARNGRHLSCFGKALQDRGRAEESGKILDSAIAALREEIQLHPDCSNAHLTLGNAQAAQGKNDEAIAEYRTAIKLKPDIAFPHSNLGNAFYRQGKYDEAVAECRTAIKLKPGQAGFHDFLGNALLGQGKPDEAIAEYRTALKLTPDDAAAHLGLGDALGDQGKLDEAIAEYRTALKLKPGDATAHSNLGKILCDQVHDYPAAEAAFRQAIRLKPDLAGAHYNLGNALGAQGKLDQAIAEFRTAIKLKLDLAEAHVNLGNALQAQGKHDEAIAEYRTALKLNPDIRGASWRTHVEALAAVAERLPAIVRGDDKPRDAAEGFAAGRICYDKGLYAAAAGLYKQALALDPKRAGDRQDPPRYDAACCAALAGTGQSKDVPPPDEAARRRLRNQVRDWLIAELADWAKFLRTQGPRARPVAVQMLQHWKVDPDLAGIRDRDALKKLPTDEQKAWAAVWKDVDALLNGEAISQPR
jgi:superkiller protein 3